MLLLKRSTVFPIGVDVGHDCVRMIQLERLGEKLSVVAAAKIGFSAELSNDPTARGATVGAMVRAASRQGRFRGKQVVAALPGELLHVRCLRVPIVAATELATVVRAEAEGTLPFQSNKAALQFLPAGEVRQAGEARQEVILLAARHLDISDYVSGFGSSGLVLEALDVAPCALYRTVGRFVRRREDGIEVHAMVHIGARRTQVVIGRGSEVNFIKLIQIGSRHLHDAVIRKLGVTAEEMGALQRRLAEPSADGEHDPIRQAVDDSTRAVLEDLGREISLCLRYHSMTFRGHRPAKVRLTGEGVDDPQLQAVLGRMVALPIEPAKVMINVEANGRGARELKGLASEWAVALGLALKSVKGSYGPRDGTPRASLNTPVLCGR